MKGTQHSKIINLCSDGGFHCQNEFRALFIFSPHKRRNEIAGKERESDPSTTGIDFIKRKCEHGIRGQFDYKMIRPAIRFEPPLPSPMPIPKESQPQLLKV